MRFLKRCHHLEKLTGILALAAAISACQTTVDARNYQQIRVSSNDSVVELAERYQIPLADLMRINRLHRPSQLRAGMILNVPRLSPDMPKPSRGLLFSEAAADSDANLQWPVSGKLSSGFGRRRGRLHKGIDITATRGSEITAAASGRVLFAGWKRRYGRTVVIEHDGFRTLYAHCHKLLVRSGRRVRQGDLVALVGASGNAEGPHLHFEIHDDLNRPRDPLPYFDQRAPAYISSR